MSGWKGRRVLVTGATGLVGSWLTSALLDEGAEVTALVRDWDPQSELIRSGRINHCSVVSGRLEDYGDLVRAVLDHDVDTVFHLGAQAIVGTAFHDPRGTFEANIRGTYNLLEACRARPGQVRSIVVASSDKAYGSTQVLPYTEDMPVNGRHPYDVSKSCTDLLAMTYATTYGLPVTVARCGNIYGGGDLNWSRIVPGTLRMALEGHRPQLRSDGSLTRDYVYVEDVVGAYLALAEAAPREDVRGQAFNFSPESQTSVLEIVNAVLKAVGREDLQPEILNQAAGEIQDQYLDSAKARRVLGWEPRWTLEAGLQATVQWYRTFLGMP
jgi:CDP-glucose 4,6-dehydratase